MIHMIWNKKITMKYLHGIKTSTHLVNINAYYLIITTSRDCIVTEYWGRVWSQYVRSVKLPMFVCSVLGWFSSRWDVSLGVPLLHTVSEGQGWLNKLSQLKVMMTINMVKVKVSCKSQQKKNLFYFDFDNLRLCTIIVKAGVRARIPPVGATGGG